MTDVLLPKTKFPPFIFNSIDHDHEIIDINLYLNDKWITIEGFDDINWEEANEYGESLSKELNIEYRNVLLEYPFDKELDKMTEVKISNFEKLENQITSLKSIENELHDLIEQVYYEWVKIHYDVDKANDYGLVRYRTDNDTLYMVRDISARGCYNEYKCDLPLSFFEEDNVDKRRQVMLNYSANLIRQKEAENKNKKNQKIEMLRKELETLTSD